jgi:hydroxyacylglutathione hydrolase
MKIERFEAAGLAQYSYVVSDRGEAAVIDPMRDVERYVEYAAANGLRVTAVLETHIHADYASGALALADRTGAELCLSGYDAGERFAYEMPHRAMRDGDGVDVGRFYLQALHTPGHTPEHLSFLLFDGGGTRAIPLAMFSGDFLFVGSFGRPDLLGEDAKLTLAQSLYHSVAERIACLPDGVQVYPGHGAGSLCGAGMSERAESTLGYERATNPYFGYAEADFVEAILASVPPMPIYYPRMKSLNARGAVPVEPLPGGVVLRPQQVAELAAQPDVTLVDVRSAQAFAGAHVGGALHLGGSGNVALWSGWLLQPGSRIVLIGDGGSEDDVRRGMVRVGLDRIEGYLAGGMQGWISCGLDFVRGKLVDVTEVASCGDALVLDVRTASERRAGYIAGSKHVMLGDLPEWLGSVPRDLAILTVCGSGYRSSSAASLLQRAGFWRVGSMDGGMSAWRRRDLPMARGAV